MKGLFISILFFLGFVSYIMAQEPALSYILDMSFTKKTDYNNRGDCSCSASAPDCGYKPKLSLKDNKNSSILIQYDGNNEVAGDDIFDVFCYNHQTRKATLYKDNSYSFILSNTVQSGCTADNGFYQPTFTFTAKPEDAGKTIELDLPGLTGCNTWKLVINIVEVIEVPSIVKVNNMSEKQFNDQSFCSNMEIITFELDRIIDSDQDVFIQCSNSVFFPKNNYYDRWLNDYFVDNELSNKVSLNIYEIIDPSWYGDEIYFRCYADNGDYGGSGSIFGPVKFLQQLPVPTIIETKLTSCNTDYIKIHVDNQTYTDYNDFAYSISDLTYPNVVPTINFRASREGNNILKLRYKVGNQPIIIPNKNYKFQLINGADATCAANVSITTPSRPVQLIAKSFTTQVYTFMGNTYNSKSCGSNDYKLKVLMQSGQAAKVGSVQLYQFPTCPISSPPEATLTYNTSQFKVSGDTIIIYSGLQSNKTYTVSGIYDSDGCRATNEFTNSICFSSTNCPGVLTLSTPTITPVTCHSNNTTDPALRNDGKISITISGGIGPYRGELWDVLNKVKIKTVSSGSSYNIVFDGISEGKYSVKLTDFVGNKKQSAIFTMNSRNEVKITNVLPVAESCNENDGSITINTNKTGSGLWSYSLDSVISSSTLASFYFDNKKAGSYLIVVSDEKDCKVDTNAIVTKAQAFTLVDETTQNSSQSSLDGKFTLSITGGTSPFHLRLVRTFPDPDLTIYNSNITGSDYTNDALSTGTYSYEVSDANSCFQNGTFTLNAPSVGFALNCSSSNVKCNGNTDGEINLKLIDGNIPFNINVFKESTNILENYDLNLRDLEIPNLGTGNYIITASSSSVERSCAVVITEPNPLNISSDVITTLCTETPEGIGTITVSGGIPPYSYSLDDKFSVIIDKTITHLSLGSNTMVYIKDFNGCIANHTISVPEVNASILNNEIKPLIDPVLFIADSAKLGESIVVIDASYPVPDSIGWKISGNFATVTTNDYSATIKPLEAGKISITLTVWSGICYTETTQELFISDSEITEANLKFEKIPLIIDFRIYPNPSSGEFEAEVSLSETANIVLELFSANPLRKIQRTDLSGLEKYVHYYSLGHIPSGVYILNLSAGSEKRSLKLVKE